MAKEIPQEDIDKLLHALKPAADSQAPAPKPAGQAPFVIDEDFSGELNHNGTVIIKGRLLPGSRIKTTGYLTVTHGITGAAVSAGKGIGTPFIEMSTVICQDDVLVTSHILSSTVRSAGGIYCAAGSFIRGGSCKAYYTIQADVFGHTLGSRTELQLIKSAPELTVPWDPAEKADPYMHKIVALKKVWNGTLLAIRDYSYFLRKSCDGPFVLDIQMMGGTL